MNTRNRPIVLIRRKKVREKLRGHGAWKIAYADFMTAMMSFFLVMWLLSISSPKERGQIADFFKMPLKVALSGGQRSSDSESPIPGGGEDSRAERGEVTKANTTDTDAGKIKQDNLRLNRLRERLYALIKVDPRLRALRQHLLISMVERGLRVQIVDSRSRPMFSIGSAQVEPYMRDILRAIAPVLNDIPNRISLAGHTDDFQYASGERGYSNWELSADRANASRRELVAGGLDGRKILRVAGMADTMKLKNRGGYDAGNRRISVLVLNHHTEALIEKENAESDVIQADDAESMKKTVVPVRSGAAKPAPSSQPASPTPGVALKPVARTGSIGTA